MPVVVMQIPQQRGRATRAELTAMGLTPAQADHELVRQSELEVIETSITRWVMLFGCIICALLPVSLVLFFYLIYSYILEQWQDCDVPLTLWFWVAMFNIFYHINLGGRSIHRQVIRTEEALSAVPKKRCRLPTVCRYQAPEQSLEVPPARVRLYHWLTTIFVFSWHCVGLHWARVSQTCHDTAPNLFTSTYLFASFNVIFTIFTVISTYGLQHMLASLLRRGLLPSSMLGDRAAPEGTLELQSSVIFDPEEFGDSLQCPMCLEDFSKEQPIRKTICGHYFHESCLAQWFKVNRTCPLCRRDLAESLESGEQAEPEATATSFTALRPERIGADQASSVETPASDTNMAAVGVIAFEEPPRNQEVVVQANTRQR
eukprot:g7993.t1